MVVPFIEQTSSVRNLPFSNVVAISKKLILNTQEEIKKPVFEDRRHTLQTINISNIFSHVQQEREDAASLKVNAILTLNSANEDLLYDFSDKNRSLRRSEPFQ